MEKIVTIHIAESGTSKDGYLKTAVIGAVVTTSDHTREPKEEIKKAIKKSGYPPSSRTITWSMISPKEQNLYMNVLSVINKDKNLRYYGIKIRYFTNKKLMPAYLELVNEIMKDFPDYNARVFVQTTPKEHNRYEFFSAYLKKRKIDIQVEQAPISEDRFIQCADLISGAVLFFNRDDMYLEKIGQPGKAAVVEYGLGLKKGYKKFNIVEFK